MFTANKKAVESIMLSAAWYNDVAKEEALRRRYDVQSISFVTKLKGNTNKPESFVDKSVVYLKRYRNKYYNSIDQDISADELTNELGFAVFCAVRCDDVDALRSIGAKSKQFYNEWQYSKWKNTSLFKHNQELRKRVNTCLNYKEEMRNNWNIALLMSVVERDKMDTFTEMVNVDPFMIDNCDTFLDALNKADYISQDLKDKYSNTYKQLKPAKPALWDWTYYVDPIQWGIDAVEYLGGK